MQKYNPKTPLAAFTDKLFRLLLAYTAGTAWFIFLWDVSVPALAAGAALGGLLWLCIRKFSKHATARNEKRMRLLIGGELALQRLWMETPRKAGFQAAAWISRSFPLTMERTADWGVMGMLENQKTLIRVIVQHESVPINAQQLVEVQREARSFCAQRCVLCLTAPLTKEAAEYAYASDGSLTVVPREAMIEYAGVFSPATDEDLLSLKPRKRAKRTREEWINHLFAPSKIKNYFWYGVGMTLLAILTGKPFYPVPAVICLLLCITGKIIQSTKQHTRKTL